MLDARLEGLKVNSVKKAELLGQLILEMEVKGMEVNKSLESIITRMSKDLPRVVKEVSQQKDEISNFKSVIENARGVVTSQNLKSTSLQSLAFLDRAVERVKATQLYLKDADNWNTVSAEMESLFAANDLEKATSRLIEAERSFQLLLSNPNAKNVEERKELLSSLRVRLLGSFRAELSNFVLSSNLADANSILKLYERLDSIQEARQVLFDIKSGPLSALWPVVKPGQEMSLLLQEFEVFLQDLLSKLSSECMPLYTSVFTEAHAGEIHFLVAYVLSKVEPHISLHLERMEKEGKELFIVSVAQLYHIFVKFGSRLEDTFPVKTIGVDHYGKSVFEAFLPFQMKYESYEKSYLDHVLRIEVFNPKNLTNFLQIARTVRTRFLLFTFGLIKLDFEAFMDRFLTDVIGRTCEILKQSSSWTHEGDFSALIGNLRSAIEFSKELESFWTLLSLKDSSLASTCKSSAAILKGLRRDFHIVESSRVFEAKGKASEFVVLWQMKALQSLLSPVDDHLEKVDKLPAWSKDAPVGENMQFSLSPLAYITQIGEFMLTLPQSFEPFSQEEVLNYSLKTLPFIEKELSMVDSQEGGELIYEPIHMWIISSVRLIEEKLVGAILKIAFLSHFGLKQLETDLGYFQNVMLAVDIEPQGKFRDLLHAISLDDDALSKEIQSDSVHNTVLMKCVLSMRKKK